MLALLYCNRTFLFFASLALLALAYFLVWPGDSSSPTKCFDQGDCEVPNLIQYKVQLPIGNSPTSSGKCVFKYLTANTHLIGCIYTASVAPSGYWIIWGPILTRLITLTGVLHTREGFPSRIRCHSLFALPEKALSDSFFPATPLKLR